MTENNQTYPGRALVAGLLAWLIPGAGHVYLGRTVRGVIICICIHAMFWSGVAVGGVFTVEPLRERWWFSVQMATGVSGLAGWVHQDRMRRRITSRFEDPRLRSPTPVRGRRDEWWKAYTAAQADKGVALVYPASVVARAYTGIAGMLNLMCVFDVVCLGLIGRLGEPDRAGRRKPPDRPGEDAP